MMRKCGQIYGTMIERLPAVDDLVDGVSSEKGSRPQISNEGEMGAHRVVDLQAQ
jgi:hypothetical protein